jgi:hypothetical protein
MDKKIEDKGEPTTLTLIVWGVLVMVLAGWIAAAWKRFTSIKALTTRRNTYAGTSTPTA